MVDGSRATELEPGRAFGTEVEVASGLGGYERLMTNPTDDLRAGMPVHAVAERQSMYGHEAAREPGNCPG